MAHLLVIELPGGNDGDIISAAIKRGDTFTFLAARMDHYTNQLELFEMLFVFLHFLTKENYLQIL